MEEGSILLECIDTVERREAAVKRLLVEKEREILNIGRKESS